MNEPLLNIQGLNIRFGDKQVVHDVTFDVSAGEKIALVGESGSGKSVIALSMLKLIAGASIAGQIVLDGVDLVAMSERDLSAVRGRDISVIFQEPMTALNPLYTVGEQIAEVYRVKHGLGARQAWGKAVERLAETDIPDPARRARAYPHQLSGGQRQRAMIAMALASEPRVLLADEPTTALDVTLRVQILALLDQLQRKRNMAVLLITHDLNLVRRFAQRVIVLQAGRIVEVGEVSEVFTAPRHTYTQKLLDSIPVRDVIEVTAGQEQPEVVLDARGVSVSYRLSATTLREVFKPRHFSATQDISLVLRRGRTLGIIGESGSGKSTLAQAVLGLLPFQGNITIAGSTWHAARQQGFEALKALRRKIQVVFQDPYASLSPRMSVQRVVGEALSFHEPSLSTQVVRERVLTVLGEVGLTETLFPNLLERYPHEFSGGQRQRIAIARALITHPDILVLDEPTSALDVTIQRQVLSLLQALQKRLGISFLLITHDMDVVHAMAHDVIVMKDGSSVEYGSVLDVMRSPQHDYTRKLIQSSEVNAKDIALISTEEDTARESVFLRVA
ncbi:ABC transporter ATP-binding protein [Advenella mimigardefordensis]|uniref:ABC transporter ATP-binding protein n=1 Tax=Advenella mimigardefordensis (strain DSM 17166 / LMG 22922 / DPN7) TaxID=1247726 RepID=W0PFU0_ADVMD|nr:dipeptide ABC transporter ATP-binding protein [Advenella mimigardefordensis]AHG65546.1 ABC transporter ATP-binding protein [Advenella mimigardefordensis DPN7]